MNEFDRSRRRWRTDSTACGLTWGALIDGRGTLDALRRHGLLDSSPHAPREGAVGNGLRAVPRAPRVLEIGPGYGRLYRAVRDAGIACHWTGLDINLSSAHELQRELPTATWLQGDCEVALPTGPYSLIVSTLCLKHLYPDFGRAARRARQALTAGGALAFDVPESRTPDDGAWEAETDCWTRRYTRADVLAILTAAGYRSVEFGDVDHTPERRRLFVVAR